MRIDSLPTRKYSLLVRPLFWLQRRKHGQVLFPALLWGRCPLLFLALSCLYGVLTRKRGRLDAALRALVLLRVSQVNQCNFCIDINSAHLAHWTGTLDKLTALSRWRESALFDDRDKCALEYAEAMTLPGHGVQDELFGRLRGFFDQDAIVELTALIGYQNMATRFNSALDIPSQGFCGWVSR